LQPLPRGQSPGTAPFKLSLSLAFVSSIELMISIKSAQTGDLSSVLLRDNWRIIIIWHLSTCGLDYGAVLSPTNSVAEIIVNEFVSAELATGVFSERLGLLVENTS